MGVGMCDHLFCVDLNRTKVDFMQVENRRFMYHPNGLLIMGAEGTANGNGLAKSHAEEYHEAKGICVLPSYDDFVRGWIGRGRGYEDGVIHFTPPVVAEHIEMFEKAFDFIEAALENGFNKNAILRGFPGAWEQKIQEVVSDVNSLDDVLDDAKARAIDNSGSYEGKECEIFK